MKVLLLGGTGAMGLHLTHLLAERGAHVVVTTRHEYVDRRNVSYRKGNAHDEEFSSQLLAERWDVIVDFMVYRTEEFRSCVSKLLAATSQYVFLSSARVYGPTPSGTRITEDTPRLLDITTDDKYLKTDEYALTKARQENILRESSGNNWTIIRPYITYSEIRFQLGVLEKEDWLYRTLHGHTIVFSRDIAQHYTTLTYGLDVAHGIAGLVGMSSAFGETYHIATEETCRWSEILDVYLNVVEKQTGKRSRVVLTDECINLRVPSMQYQVKYCRMFDRRFDNTKIMTAIPTLRFSNTKANLEQCLTDFLADPIFLSRNILLHALMDKVAGERMPFSEIYTRKQYFKYLIVRYAPQWVVSQIFN